jgi:HEAT repeat protein
MGLRKAVSAQPDKAEPVEGAAALDALTRGGETERRRAAHALAEGPGNEDALLAQLAREQEPAVTEALMLALIRLSTPEAARGLADFLRSEDAAKRNGVIEALAAMPQSATPIIEDLLADKDGDVRIFACDILLGLPDRDAPLRLAHVLMRDPNANVCAAAIECLAEIGTAECISALEAVIERFADIAFIGFAARETIERIRRG